MIATHNIKVNGRWYAAGEEYEVEEPQAVKETAVAEEVVSEAAPQAEEPKASPKPRTASTRRKASK